MGAYQYQALQKSGQDSNGVIEADSERHARQLLRDMGLVPTKVTTLNKQTVSKKKGKLAANDLCLLTRQLATLLAAGIPVEESLSGVAQQTEKEKVREIIIGVRSKVVEGYSLAQAMQQYPHAFPELYRATVGAGEQTGRLDLVLEKLAEYTETQQVTRQKIQQALIYPMLMVVVSTAIIGFLLSFVVPKIIEVFTNSGQTLPGMTVALLTISNFLKDYAIYIITVLFVLLIAFRRALSNHTFKMRWHALLLKMPVIAYLSRSINVARYIHTFGILFSAGVNVLETMRVSASVVSNLVIRDAFDAASVKVKEGAAISDSLKTTTYLSPMATHLIASGEKSGQIAPMMERAASHLDNEVKRLIDAALTLLEPIVILFMGAVVLFIVLATLLPIFSMEQLVT